MYFPIGWPKVLKNLGSDNQINKQIVSNRDKILFASLSDDCLTVWFCKVRYQLSLATLNSNTTWYLMCLFTTYFYIFQPTVPIVFHKRSDESLKRLGVNIGVEWKPDSSMICIAV